MLEIKMCDHCTNHEYFLKTTKRRSHEIDKCRPVLVKPSQVRNYIIPVYPPPPPKKKEEEIYTYRQGRRQAVCLGGGGGGNCKNVSLLLREPYNFSPALKESLSGGSGGRGGGGYPYTFPPPPTSKNIPHTFRNGVRVLSWP